MLHDWERSDVQLIGLHAMAESQPQKVGGALTDPLLARAERQLCSSRSGESAGLRGSAVGTTIPCVYGSAHMSQLAERLLNVMERLSGQRRPAASNMPRHGVADAWHAAAPGPDATVHQHGVAPEGPSRDLHRGGGQGGDGVRCRLR